MTSQHLVFTDARAWTPQERMTFAYEQGQAFFQHQQQARRKPRDHFLAALERGCEIFPLNVDEQCALVDGYRAALRRRSN